MWSHTNLEIKKQGRSIKMRYIEIPKGLKMKIAKQIW